MTRLVVDANVLLSGVVSPPESPPALLLAALQARAFEGIGCPTLIGQIDRGLRKPYFRSRLDKNTSQRLLRRIRRAIEMFDDPVDSQALLRDPTDDYLVALARKAKAVAIVTGDKDLLEHPDLKPPGITPRDACKLIGLSQDPS